MATPQDRLSEDRQDFWQEEECSPVFAQFLDCVHQLLRQFPNEFEFNLEFLSELLDQVYDCKASTFLGDCDRERRVLCMAQHGKHANLSVWDLMRLGPNKKNGTPQRASRCLRNPFFKKLAEDEGNCAQTIFPDCHPRSLHIWSQRYFSPSNCSRSEKLCERAVDAAWLLWDGARRNSVALNDEQERNRRLVSDLERAHRKQAELMRRIEMLTGAKDGIRPMSPGGTGDNEANGTKCVVESAGDADGEGMVVVTRTDQGRLVTENVVNSHFSSRDRRHRRATTAGVSNPSSRRNSGTSQQRSGDHSRRGSAERRQTIVGAALNGVTRWMLSAATSEGSNESRIPLDFFRTGQTASPSHAAQQLGSTLNIGVTEDRYF